MLVLSSLLHAPANIVPTAFDPRLTATLLLGGAAVTFYVAARATADASTDRQRGLVLAGVVPVAVAATAAASLGLVEVAMSLVMATAVALVTIVLGMALLTRPAADIEAQRASPGGAFTLLPTGIVVLLAGNGGRFGVIEVGLLVVVAGGLLWTQLPAWQPKHVVPVKIVQAVLAVGLVLLGGWLARLGAAALGAGVGRDLGGIDATMLAGPMLALPMIGLAVPLGAAGRHAAVTASLCSAATLVAGVVLPVVALIALVLNQGEAVAVAPRLFRVDAAVLAVVGLLVLPFAAGRWRPGAGEGIGLLLLYTAYLIVNVAAAR